MAKPRGRADADGPILLTTGCRRSSTAQSITGDPERGTLSLARSSAVYSRRYQRPKQGNVKRRQGPGGSRLTHQTARRKARTLDAKSD
jgi:hypothetical protein